MALQSWQAFEALRTTPMNAKQVYAQAMEWTYIACIVVSGAALVAITLMIPLGVFMRYAMNNALSWPEPAAIVLMVAFSFIGGAAVLRANGHMAVDAVLNAVSAPTRKLMKWGVHGGVALMGLFMLIYGARLCEATWLQSLAEFPGLRQGIVYLPIPISGALMLLFLIERVWIGDPPSTSIMHSDQATELE